MGRKLDALLGRNFKTSKFKTLLKLGISRCSILLNQHHVRSSQARSDLKELLVIGQQDRAMLRVEHAIKEQNMVDLFDMIDFYLNLLLERVKLIKESKECHEELGEAISSLIYAASRCGDFPELQRIREILTSRFGKDFAARAVELRNNCGVNPKMVHKFSTRRSSFETKAKFLQEIASDCGLTLHLEEQFPLRHDKSVQVEKVEESKKGCEDKDENVLAEVTLFKDIKDLEEFSESMKVRRTYTGVVAAAQDAFESAAHAAIAAKAAVELAIRNDHESHHDHDDRADLDINLSSSDKALAIEAAPEEESSHGHQEEEEEERGAISLESERKSDDEKRVSADHEVGGPMKDEVFELSFESFK